MRFETAPGRQGQVDFAHFRLPWGKRYALIVVLGYSRLLWVQFYTRQTSAADRACRPYRAQTKGKVERPIRYLRESFFYGRTFTSLSANVRETQRT